MIESRAFFLPVKNVLERLQADDFTRIPFQNILVTGDGERLDRVPGHPEYLGDNDPIYNMDALFQTTPENSNVYVKDGNWNNETNMIIKDHQLLAMKAALQGSISIIQGPPGTGKTFIAKLVMRVLLENAGHWYGVQRTPILLICYTNHALDQFIEGILNFEESIVRYGGNSKNERVAQYSIREQRTKIYRSNPNRSLYRQAKMAEEAVAAVQDKRFTVEEAFERAFTDVVSPEKLYDAGSITEAQLEFILSDLRAKLDENTFKYMEQPIDEDPQSRALNLMKVWLGLDYLPYLNGNLVQLLHAQEFVVEEETFDDFDEENIERMSQEHIDDKKRKERAQFAHEKAVRDEIIRQIFNQPCVKRHEQSECDKWMNANDSNNNFQNGNKKKEKGGKEAFYAHFNQKYLKLADKWIRQIRNNEKWTIENAYENFDRKKTGDQLWNEVLKEPNNRQNRILWYGSIVEKYQNKMEDKLRESDDEMKNAAEVLANVRILQDTDVCKRFRIVAMTTTIATKNFRLIQNLGCKIIMAEEAAELPESHLVACITEHTQQMILIGDHQQLRPKVNCYELERKCNLDISLFERMIKNQFQFVRLGEQHRMQPDISAFMSTCFYENLKDHDSTINRENDKINYLGERGRVQFINYGTIEEKNPDFYEATEDEGTSKSNKMEAEYTFLIAQHLIRSGYKAENITILTFYIGQFFLIREKVRNQLPKESRPDVQTVDNYQGQENQVIILSTVRSNEDFKGGFAVIKNRACVALSRARSALIVVGNLEMLRHAGNYDNVWSQVMRKAEEEGVMTEGLRLECPWHPRYKIVVPYVKEKEFTNAINEAFPCGGCKIPCSTVFDCGHQCPKTCHDPEEHSYYKCTVLVYKQLPCGHSATIQCHIKPEDYRCMEKCERRIESCGHACQLRCCMECTETKCQEPVQKTCVVCSNVVTKECRKKKELEKPCEQICIFEMKTCGHICKKKCHPLEVHQSDPCLEPCTESLPCGHACPLLCKDHTSSDIHDTYQCQEKCERACKKCGGRSCIDKCFVECKPCELKVQKTLPCGHWKKGVPCNVPAEDVKCETNCKKELTCGHQCKQKCWQECDPEACTVRVEKALPCGHSAMIPCNMRPEDFECKKKCTKKYEHCGHPCVQKCFETCDPTKCTVPHFIDVPCNGDYKETDCKEIVSVKLECLHSKDVECWRKDGIIECDKEVLKQLPCRHINIFKCSILAEDVFCSEQVEHELSCGHTRVAECGKTDEDLVKECKQPCKRKLPCDHQCKGKCNQKCNPKRCKELVQTKCKDCDGFVTVECATKKIIKKCTNECKIRLDCGHQCPEKCHQGEPFDHKKIKCKKSCERECDKCGKRTCKKLCFEKCQERF